MLISCYTEWSVILENMQKQGEMHCDTEIVILIGTSEYIFKMLLENGIGYKGRVKKRKFFHASFFL